MLSSIHITPSISHRVLRHQSLLFLEQWTPPTLSRIQFKGVKGEKNNNDRKQTEPETQAGQTFHTVILTSTKFTFRNITVQLQKTETQNNNILSKFSCLCWYIFLDMLGKCYLRAVDWTHNSISQPYSMDNLRNGN